MNTCISYIDGKGRGVVALDPFKKDDIVEKCCTVVIPKEDVEKIKNTYLWNIYYEFPDGSARLALGNGSLYNHSKQPNLRKEWTVDYVFGDILYLIADRDIKAGEELTHNYNFDIGTEPDWVDT